MRLKTGLLGSAAVALLLVTGLWLFLAIDVTRSRIVAIAFSPDAGMCAVLWVDEDHGVVDGPGLGKPSIVVKSMRWHLEVYDLGGDATKKLRFKADVASWAGGGAVSRVPFYHGAVGWSPNGKRIAVATPNGTRVYMTGGDLIGSWVPNTNGTASLLWPKDGLAVVVLRSEADYRTETAQVFALEVGQGVTANRLHSLSYVPGMRRVFSDVLLSEDRLLMEAADVDRDPRQYGIEVNLKSGVSKEVDLLPSSLSVAPDGGSLINWDNRSLVVTPIGSGEPEDFTQKIKAAVGKESYWMVPGWADKSRFLLNVYKEPDKKEVWLCSTEPWSARRLMQGTAEELAGGYVIVKQPSDEAGLRGIRKLISLKTGEAVKQWEGVGKIQLSSDGRWAARRENTGRTEDERLQLEKLELGENGESKR